SHQPTPNIIHRQGTATATATATVTAMATIVRRGMDARRGGRFRVETARLTKVRAVVAGTPRMDAHPVTPYRVETVRALPIWKVIQAATLLAKDRAGGIAASARPVQELWRRLKSDQ